MRKLVSLILALIMVLSLALPVAALAEGEALNMRVVKCTERVNIREYPTTKATISAPTNGAGAPAYSGTSEQFTIVQSGIATTSIDLGTPTNAKVTVALDNTFSAKYEQPRITITDGTRSVTITDTATAAAATSGQSAYGLPTVTYFDVPANGTLSYSITADAKSGSQVTDIRGATGTITVAAGRHSVITLTASSVTGEVIPIVGGEDYEGTFD